MSLPTTQPPTPAPTTPVAGRPTPSAPATLAHPAMQVWAHRLRQLGLWAGLALVLLVLANLISLRVAGSVHTLDIGYRADRHYLDGFFAREVDALGRDYRWSSGQSMLKLDPFPAVTQPRLRLDIGGLPEGTPAPRMVAVRVGPTPAQAQQTATSVWIELPVAAAPRRYEVLLPPDALRDGRLFVSLSNEAVSIPPDRREIGFRLDSFSVAWSPQAWVLPAWDVLAVQWGVVLLAAALAWRLQRRPRTVVLIGAGVLAVLAMLTGYAPFAAGVWQQRLLVVGVGLLVVVWGLFPRLSRLIPAASPAAARHELGVLMLLMLAVLSVRLLAAVYPTFDSHDWYIHADRQHLLQWGNLLLFDKPAEFSTQIAIVPPAFYILVAPLSLLTLNTVPTTQGIYAFFDGVAVLALAILVRWLGGGIWAGRLALLLLGLMPIQFTALWWGFGPQVVGQALILILAVFAIQPDLPRRWLWCAAGVVVLLVLLTHNGVALLGGIWLGSYVVLDWLFAPELRRNRLRWIGLGVAAAGAAVALLYIDVIQLQMAGVSNNDRLAFTEEDIFRVKWTLGSLCASWQPLAPRCDAFVPGTDPATVLPQIGVVLLSLAIPLTALLVLLVQTDWRGRRLVLPWLGSALLFLAVDLAFGLQVRYAYFLTPLVCAGLALALEGWLRRHRWAWAVVAAVVLLVAWAGLGLWYSGVVEAIKPSLRPLTH